MEVSGKSLFQAVMKKWWILLICLGAGAIAGVFWGAVFTSDEYVSEGRLYVTLQNVTSEDNKDRQSQITTKINECITVLSDDYFLKEQFAAAGAKKVTTAYLHKSVTFTPSGNFIIVRVATDRAEDSYGVAKHILQNAETRLKGSSLESYIFSAKPEGEASLPDGMEDKGILSKALITGFAAVIVAAIVLVIVRLNDKRLYSAEELAEVYNIPILGAIKPEEASK